MRPHSHNCYSPDFKLRGSSLSLLLEAASYHRRLCKGPRGILQLYKNFAATSCAYHFPLLGSSVDEVHVIVDRILITGQNDESTALAVKNFIWLATQEGQGKEKSK